MVLKEKLHLFRYLCVHSTEQDKLDAINLMVYVFNSVIMLVDLMTVTHPIILGHTYWTIGMGMVYTIFTAIYYLAGGTSRYIGDRRLMSPLHFTVSIVKF